MEPVCLSIGSRPEAEEPKMEIDGHPTQDMVDELLRRGAVLHSGNSLGPETLLSKPPGDQIELERGLWLFLPPRAYDTEIDEGLPPL